MEEEKEIIRIYVGGLVDSVTADEIRRLFELSGGAVESLELVRSKARSFAYVDFSPSSEKSLPKLFTKYNGCVWKGGKLKLQKAKEHYLKRLAREWAEEAASEANGNTTVESPQIPQDLTPPEKREIRIFFPRLRKVKVLPFSGTGKHKYSFQRIDVSSPPKYFCDCEEHAGPAEKEKKVCHVEPESGGVNQDELNIMNKVMNTLFQQQNCEAIDNNIIAVAGNAETEADDDDDLVINFVSKGSDEFPPLEQKQVGQVFQNHLKSGTREQRPKRGRPQEQEGLDNEPQSKKKRPLSNENSGDRLKSAHSASKGNLYANLDKPTRLAEAKQVEPESSKRRSNAHVSWSQKSSWKKLVGDKGSSTFSIASTEEDKLLSDHPGGSDTDNKKENSERDIAASTEKDEPKPDAINAPNSDYKTDNSENGVELEGATMKTEGLVEAQPAKPNVASSQTRRGATWMQKSSWTQLVGDNVSFSISRQFPSTTSTKQVLEKPKEGNALSPVEGKIDERENQAIDRASVLVTEKEEFLKSTSKDDEQATTGNSGCLTSVSEEKCDVAVAQIPPPVRVEVSETCTFMRSAASLKEWAKAKAALSGSLKRKGNQK